MRDDGWTIHVEFDTTEPMPDDDRGDDLLDDLALYGGCVAMGRDLYGCHVTLSVRPATLDAPAALAEGIRVVRAAARRVDIPVTSVEFAEVMTFAELDRRLALP